MQGKGFVVRTLPQKAMWDDDSQEGDPDGAVASEPKKTKKLTVRANKTGIECITETVNKQHAEQMSKSDTVLGFLGELVKMQKVKMMQDLGVPTADILKTMDIQLPSTSRAAEEKEAHERLMADTKKIVAAQLKKVKIYDEQ